MFPTCPGNTGLGTPFLSLTLGALTGLLPRPCDSPPLPTPDHPVPQRGSLTNWLTPGGRELAGVPTWGQGRGQVTEVVPGSKAKPRGRHPHPTQAGGSSKQRGNVLKENKTGERK